MIKLLLILSLVTYSFIAFANEDSVRANMIRDWERAKEYTLEYLHTMPANQFSYRPHDSVRTFAQQMLHLAQGNIGLSANGTGANRIFAGFNLEQSASAQSSDSVIYYVTASYDFVINGIQQMDMTKMEEKAGRGRFVETRDAWIRKAFEHQTHHRGQTTIYIRMLGIKPPNERLF